MLNAGLVFRHPQEDEAIRSSDPARRRRRGSPQSPRNWPRDLLHPPHQQRPGIADHRHQPAPRTTVASPRRTPRSGATRLASPAMDLPSITADPASLEPGLPRRAATLGDRPLAAGRMFHDRTPLTMARIRCIPGTGRAATIAVWSRRPPAGHWLCDPDLPAHAVTELSASIAGRPGRTARGPAVGRPQVAAPGRSAGLTSGCAGIRRSAAGTKQSSDCGSRRRGSRSPGGSSGRGPRHRGRPSRSAGAGSPPR